MASLSPSSPQAIPPSTAPVPITRAQSAIMAVYGAILWFLAAVIIRTIEPLGGQVVPGILLVYALMVPGFYPFILLARRIAGLRHDQTLIGVAIATGTAALIDAHALIFIPELYGPKPTAAGATILWGIGVVLLMAAIMNRPVQR